MRCLTVIHYYTANDEHKCFTAVFAHEDNDPAESLTVTARTADGLSIRVTQICHAIHGPTAEDYIDDFKRKLEGHDVQHLPPHWGDLLNP